MTFYSIKSKPNNISSSSVKALLSLALFSGSCLWMIPALADGTAAGTAINNTAVGSFDNPNDIGNTQTVTSNTVTVTVAEIAGINATFNGFQEASAGVSNAGPTQGNGQIDSEDIVYLTYRITNVGNSATQFFIPDVISSITNATQAGAIQIISYNAIDLTANNITVTAGGAATGTLLNGVANTNNGSVSVGSYIEVQVPVKLNSGLTATDTVTAVLGNTPPNDNSAATQNQVYNDDTHDLYTEDNPDATDDVAGSPTNGDSTNHRQEASAQATVAVLVAARDYGDLPDTTGGTGVGDYQTLAANGGPSHFTNATTFLGAGVTSEADGQVANGDATDDANDDGVEVGSNSLQNTSVLQGESVTLDVTTATGSNGYLNVWFDWDQDGVFEATEQVATDLTPTNDSITISVTVPFSATAGATYALVRYSEDANVGATGIGGYGEVETYQVTVIDSSPQLTLVKRVTEVGGTDVTGFVDDGTPNNDDNNPNWPANTYLAGSINTSVAAPGDEIEYTIYFLSSGNDAITNLKICDMVPANTTYVAGSLSLSFNGTTTALTDIVDVPVPDAGEAFSGAPANGLACPADNGAGGIVVSVVSSPTTLPPATGPGTPGNSYGFIRFKVTLD